tara:strand:+ start:342 stop:725 length:384 start_codon:yes stop_codon:yes gene_type:complete
MKKLLILSLTILLFSCGDSDSDSSNNVSINPPSWIQGVWALESTLSLTVGRIIVDFRTDDFCQGQVGIGLTCWKEQGTYFDNFSVYEEVSNTRYFVIMSYGPGEQTFEFDKVSNTSMISNGNTYIKQ